MASILNATAQPDTVIFKDGMKMTIEEIMAKERWATEEAYLRGNVDAFDEVFAPDCRFHSYPHAPDFTGLEIFKQAGRDALIGFTYTGIDWEEVVCQGNVGVHRYTFNMKHTGVFEAVPVPPTGKDVYIKGSAFYHVKNDRIVEMFIYGDMLGFMQQLGAIPETGQ
jgi:predicted ester cyclase